MQTVTTEWLKNIKALSNVPDEQLQWLIDNSQHYEVQSGEYVSVPGNRLAGTHIVISGRVLLYTLQNNIKREIADVLPGSITGYLPYSRGKVSFAYSKVIETVQLMTLPEERIMDLIKNHYELTQAFVGVMSDRVRDFTTMQQQNEKMMALGKLSAGLAHELNNPASAIVRDSISLKKHLQMQPDEFKNLVGLQMSPQQIETLSQKLLKIIAESDFPHLTLKQRSAREEELVDWFDEHEIDNSDDLAENFTDFDLKIDDLEDFKKYISDKDLSGVFNWINGVLVTEKLVEDIKESSQRIADLVKSVKNFTHMDRGQDKQYANIHNGIENTLTMLGYKIKKGKINLIKDYDETLPQVKAMIGELNQVWTNLIDNAIDAMETNGKGTLTIKTQKDREFVLVTIADDGPGVPEDLQTRIFEPFFTTKEIGKGTGMGLEVVQRIVQQHRGSIKVHSAPGRTEFVVCFPING